MLAMTVSLVITLALAEFGLRIFAPQIVQCRINYEWRADDEVLPYVPKASYNGKMVLKGQFDADLTTDAQGFRNLADFSFEKPADTLRIAFIGDSFMFGWGVGDKEILTYLLARDLKSAGNGKNVEVINAAVYGFDIVQYRELFYRLLKYAPDAIFLGFCLENDFNITPLKNDTIVTEGIRIEKEGSIKYRVRNAINSLHLVALIRDRLYINFPKIRNLMLSMGVNNKRDIFLKEYTADLKKSLAQTGVVLKEMEDVSREKGIRFIVLLVPLKEQVYCRDEINKFDGYNIDRPNQALEEILERDGIEYLDLLPGLLAESKKTQKRLYFDIDPHWTKYGHEVVEKSIFNAYGDPLLSGKRGADENK